MTREALAQDRGLQPERTDLAWSRTSLAVLLAGGLLLLKGHDVSDLAGHPGRVIVGLAAAAVTAAVLCIGVRRRRNLTDQPLTARREVRAAGAAILVLSTLVVVYLLLPLML